MSMGWRRPTTLHAFAVVLSVLGLVLPPAAYAIPRRDGPPVQYFVVHLGEEGSIFLDGSLAPEKFGDEVLGLINGQTEVGADELLSQIISAVAMGGTIQPPTGPDGQPVPPPLRLPPGPDGEPNPWVPGEGTPSRPIRWGPQYPVPTDGGGQPNGSWDPENGHWDIHDGKGNTTRYLPDGTMVDHDNKPVMDPLPEPFLDIDVSPWWIVGLVVVVVIVVLIYVAIPGAPLVLVPVTICVIVHP